MFWTLHIFSHESMDSPYFWMSENPGDLVSLGKKYYVKNSDVLDSIWRG